MSAILNREPGTSAQSEENQVSTSTTTQQNVFTVQQIQPQAIFAGAHIDKFEGCTFNINVFCGDQSKIARLNENWPLNDRGTIVVSTTSFLIEAVWKILSPFIDEVCTKLDYEQLFLSRLDWRPVTEESQLWARAGKQIKLFMFLFLCSLVWPCNKHLIKELGQSVPENLDLSSWYRPNAVRSVLATSDKILPYRPSTRLIRAYSKSWETFSPCGHGPARTPWS